MEKIKSITTKYSSKLKYFYICGAIIAALNTLSRADYNFVLYLFMFYVWTFMDNSSEVQKQDKIGCFYILVFSLLIDFIWVLFWGGKWDTVPTLFHEMTLFFSWLGIILKICIVLFVGVLELDLIKASINSLLKKGNEKKYDVFEDQVQEK